jgi:chemotaxis protein histidine kinase CheA
MTINAGHQDEVMAELLGDFLDESGHLLHRMNEALLTLDQQLRELSFAGDAGGTMDFAGSDLLNELFRAAHSLKGLSGMLGLKEINCLTHRMENVLDAARKGQLPVDERVVELLFRSVDCLTELIEGLRDPADPPSDPTPVVEAIGELLRQCGVERAMSSQADAERILAEITKLEDLVQSATAPTESGEFPAGNLHRPSEVPPITAAADSTGIPERKPDSLAVAAEECSAQKNSSLAGGTRDLRLEEPVADSGSISQPACPPQAEINAVNCELAPTGILAGREGREFPPQSPTAEQAINPLAEIYDDPEVPQGYLPIFVDEARVALDELHDLLLSCEAGGRESISEEMMIVAHRLKGAAAAVGLRRAAKVAHLMEDLLQELTEQGLSPSPECTEILFAAVDGVRTYVEALAKGKNDASLLEAAALKLTTKGECICGNVPPITSPAPTEEPSPERTATSGQPSEGNLQSAIASHESSSAAEARGSPESAGQSSPPEEFPPDWYPFWEEAFQHVPRQLFPGQQVFVGVVLFAEGLQLVGLKARLIIEKLTNLGEILYCYPPVESLEEADALPGLLFTCVSDQHTDVVRRQLSIGGVQKIHLTACSSLEGISTMESEGCPLLTPQEESVGPEPTDRPSSLQSFTEFEPRWHESLGEALSASGGQPHGIPVTVQPVRALSPEAPGIEGIQAAEESSSKNRNKLSSSGRNQSDGDLQRVPSTTPRRMTGGSGSTSATPTSTSVGSSTPTSPQVGETLRVDIERLDELMNLTGELVIQRARLTQLVEKLRTKVSSGSMAQSLRSLREILTRTWNYHQESTTGTGLTPGGRSDTVWGLLDQLEEECRQWLALRSISNELRTSVHQLDRITDRLQQTVMNTRMVPIGPLFHRFKRVVRDLMRANGKQIRLVILGEKTELDKRMIDELADPLIHLVRNAADHGIESPEERIRLGKPPEGTLVLEACHKGNAIVIRVSDDGRGLDAEKIRRKAVEKGFLSPSEAERLTPQELYQLIWRPGLSTAEKVTEISGRGMGMDIVKAKIEALNGSVELTTEPGKGTTFTIKLPLTLAILPSLLVRVEQNIFALPVDTIVEIVQLRADQIATIQGVPTAMVRDRVIPVCRLQEIFVWNELGAIAPSSQTEGSSREDTDQKKITLVLLGDRQREIGLQVDYVVGEEDLVIKSLADNYRSIPGLTGASILGDGTVALILDVTAVIEMANRTASR